MKDKQIKAYILILNYNGFKDTIECLESVMKSSYLNFQIIVVDNSDIENEILKIENWSSGNQKFKIDSNYSEFVYPLKAKPIDYIVLKEEDLYYKKHENNLLIVKAKSNKGFAAGNNIGLKYIQRFGDSDGIIWLLNNDTVISNQTLNKIISKINKYEGDVNLTLFGTPLLEYYEPNKIQAIGGKYNKFFGLTSHVGEGLVFDKNMTTNQFSVDYPIGASMIVTTEYLKNIGLLNEEYFLFYEELDWVLRLKQKGGNLQILDIFGIYHKQGSSTKTNTKQGSTKNEFIDILSIKNRILFTKTYYKYYWFSVVFFILTITVIKRIIYGHFKRVFKIFKLVLN